MKGPNESILNWTELKYLNLVHEQTEGRILGALEVLPDQTVTCIVTPPKTSPYPSPHQRDKFNEGAGCKLQGRVIYNFSMAKFIKGARVVSYNTYFSFSWKDHSNKMMFSNLNSLPSKPILFTNLTFEGLKVREVVHGSSSNQERN